MNETRKEQPQQEEAEVENLKQELENEKRRSGDYLARLKYAQADLENLQKRTARELAEAKEYCTEPLVVQLLEIVDELEMAVKAGRDSHQAEGVTQGVKITLKKLRKILENEHVSPIECVGEPFDPLKHNAVAKIEKDDVPECMVVEEIRKGYKMKEKVIRPSLVKVAVKPDSKSKTGVKET
jgi:molecular chaperone GrpE